jgi:hypothetical protein
MSGVSIDQNIENRSHTARAASAEVAGERKMVEKRSATASQTPA